MEDRIVTNPLKPRAPEVSDPRAADSLVLSMNTVWFFATVSPCVTATWSIYPATGALMTAFTRKEEVALKSEKLVIVPVRIPVTVTGTLVRPVPSSSCTPLPPHPGRPATHARQMTSLMIVSMSLLLIPVIDFIDQLKRPDLVLIH